MLETTTLCPTWLSSIAPFISSLRYCAMLEVLIRMYDSGVLCPLHALCSGLSDAFSNILVSLTLCGSLISCTEQDSHTCM